ncbi:MAG: hypothetical protein ABF536_06130 [Liquorilactobacillus mali]
MIIVLKKRGSKGYLLAEVVIEMVLLCGLTSLFFNEQHVLVRHEKEQIEKLREIDKDLNVSKKMVIEGYEKLSENERQEIDKYKVYRWDDEKK